MILLNKGEPFQYDGITYTIGEQIAANNQSEYEGLVGVIVEIRDGDDKETENDTPDIYCQFDAPLLPEDIMEFEKRFSQLYGEEKNLEDIALDYVAMAPEMIFSTSEKRKGQKLITVYSLTEDWANNGEYGYSTDLFASRDEAIREFKIRLGIEANNGIIADLGCNSQFVEEAGTDSYECYVNGSHCEYHFIISVEEKELCLSDAFMKVVADMKIDEARIADFIKQIEPWEELKHLSDEQYQMLINDPNLPEYISDALDKNDCFHSSYWESISEIGHRLVDKAVLMAKGDVNYANPEILSS